MEIKINLSEDMVNSLLRKWGYTKEDVKISYPIHNIVNWRGECWKTVIYPKNDRPHILNKKEIRFEDIQDIIYDGVINKLFNEALVEKLLC